MSFQEPIDKYFGIPISEWISRLPNELEVDAVGLWQIIPVGIENFGLSDDLLEDFTYRCIIEILRKGAVPVKSVPDISDWIPEKKYHGSEEKIAKQIIDEWKAGELVPDHDGLWFALIQ